MDVGKGLASIRAPVTQHAWLDVLDLERLTEQGVVLEVQHPQAQVEAGTPVLVDLVQLVGTKGCPLDSGTRSAVRRDRVVILKRLVGSHRSPHDPCAPG